MCIICNVKDGYIPNDFLTYFEVASYNMRKASELMLKCSKDTYTKEQGKQYDKMHKRMKRIMREWNSIERERELHLNDK